MGFDLYGFKKGSFSANIDHFGPLWILVSNLCSFTDEQFLRGFFNNFEKFTKDEELHISQCLETYLECSPPNEHLLVFYSFVKDSGGFIIC